MTATDDEWAAWEIVHALAAVVYPFVERSCSYMCDADLVCSYCNGDAVDEESEAEFEHEEDCLWVRAKTLVAKPRTPNNETNQ